MPWTHSQSSWLFGCWPVHGNRINQCFHEDESVFIMSDYRRVTTPSDSICLIAQYNWIIAISPNLFRRFRCSSFCSRRKWKFGGKLNWKSSSPVRFYCVFVLRRIADEEMANNCFGVIETANQPLGLTWTLIISTQTHHTHTDIWHIQRYQLYIHNPTVTHIGRLKKWVPKRGRSERDRERECCFLFRWLAMRQNDTRKTLTNISLLPLAHFLKQKLGQLTQSEQFPCGFPCKSTSDDRQRLWSSVVILFQSISILRIS